MTKQIQSSLGSSHTDPFNRKYKILSKIGEGSYSEVLKCKNRETGAIYACKRLKHCYRSWNQVNDIPEIVTLRKLARHPNILQMVEIHFDPTAGRVSLVFELMDMNLYELIKDRKRLLPESRVRVMMFQLMRALRHLHKHGIFHRDVKPENILLKGIINQSDFVTEQNDLLKLGDLGSVRGLYSRPPYTEYISTRWYRSPECLLTCGYYSFKMDTWAAGCVFYEILTLRPLFPGSSELDQINRVHNVLGPPPNKILQKFAKHAEIERDYSRHTSKQARLDTIKRVLSEMKNSSYEWYFSGKEPKGVDTLLPTHVTADAKDLLKHLLQYDPDSRPSSHRALQHAYFKDLREQAQRAAREKLPTLTGPIVTIVGDEGGLEVAADDNANPVDLTTLGDSKLKLKAPLRRSSDIKEIKDNMSTKKGARKESSGKIMTMTTTYENSTPKILKEAGEIFSREPEEMDKKLVTVSSNYEPRRTEERVKLVQRTMANLRFGGDTVSPAALPYQKIYLGDEQDGDGPNSTSGVHFSAAQLEQQRRKNRRRGGSKIMEVERKKSMTIMSHDSSSGRGFPLDFIDKTSLTPDVLVRINENRRIAHMQPIISSEFKKSERERDYLSPSKVVAAATSSGREYSKSPSKVERQREREYPSPSKVQQGYSSKPPLSPLEFSPRNYQQHQQQQQQQQQKHVQKPMKGDHNQIYNLAKENIHLNTNNNDGWDPYCIQNNTNKQVRELLASLPSKKKASTQSPHGNEKLVESGGGSSGGKGRSENSSHAHIPMMITDERPHRKHHNYQQHHHPNGIKQSTHSSINSSSANKQVREILEEMRKRRDMLENLVTKEPTLQNWSKSSKIVQGVEVSPYSPMKSKSKLSESTIKRHTSMMNGTGAAAATIRRVGDDYGDSSSSYNNNNSIGSSTFRFHNNNNVSSKNSYQNRQVKQQQQQHSYGSVSELRPVLQSEKLNSYRRRQQEEQVYSNKTKIGRQPSIVKYLDSETSRIKNVRQSPTTGSPTNIHNNSSNNNTYQSSTGAASKAFPRNRYGSNLHRQ